MYTQWTIGFSGSALIFSGLVCKSFLRSNSPTTALIWKKFRKINIPNIVCLNWTKKITRCHHELNKAPVAPLWLVYLFYKLVHNIPQLQDLYVDQFPAEFPSIKNKFKLNPFQNCLFIQ